MSDGATDEKSFASLYKSSLASAGGKKTGIAPREDTVKHKEFDFGVMRRDDSFRAMPRCDAVRPNAGGKVVLSVFA